MLAINSLMYLLKQWFKSNTEVSDSLIVCVIGEFIQCCYQEVYSVEWNINVIPERKSISVFQIYFKSHENKRV